MLGYPIWPSQKRALSGRVYRLKTSSVMRVHRSTSSLIVWGSILDGTHAPPVIIFSTNNVLFYSLHLVKDVAIFLKWARLFDKRTALNSGSMVLDCIVSLSLFLELPPQSDCIELFLLCLTRFFSFSSRSPPSSSHLISFQKLMTISWWILSQFCEPIQFPRDY